MKALDSVTGLYIVIHAALRVLDVFQGPAQESRRDREATQATPRKHRHSFWIFCLLCNISPEERVMLIKMHWKTLKKSINCRNKFHAQTWAFHLLQSWVRLVEWCKQWRLVRRHPPSAPSSGLPLSSSQSALAPSQCQLCLLFLLYSFNYILHKLVKYSENPVFHN